MGKKEKYKASSSFIAFLVLCLTSFLLFNVLLVVTRENSIPVSVEKKGAFLYFSSPTLKEKTLKVSLVLDPKEERIAVANLVLSFDPERLAFIDFEPGEVFKEAVILDKTADYQQGKARVALFTMEPVGERGVLGELTFIVLEEGSGPIEISVVDKESVLTSVDSISNVLGKSYDFVYK